MAVKDLTQGKPIKTLFFFTLPMIISGCFQQFYNVVDSVIAGKMVGNSALAAIMASNPIIMSFIGIGIGSGLGCSVVISRLFGQRQYKRVKSAIYTTIISILTVAILSTIAGIFVAKPVLRLLETPDDVFQSAANYLEIYILGLFFLFLYNAASASFQALGNSTTPLFLLIFSSLFNIFLDIFFVSTFDFGIKGLAWATVIAQGISSVIASILLFRTLRNLPRNEAEEGSGEIFSFKLLKPLWVIAIPGILQKLCVSIGGMPVQNLINRYGSDVLAAQGAAIRISVFISFVFITLSQGFSNYIAQNIGAGKKENLKKGIVAALKITEIGFLFGIAICMIFAKELVSIFVNEEGSENIIKIGSEFLYITSPFQLLFGIKLVFDGFLKGAGDMISFMLSTFTGLFTRVVSAYILVYFIESYIGIWWSWSIGWIVGTCVSLSAYFSYRWKKTILKSEGRPLEI